MDCALKLPEHQPSELVTTTVPSDVAARLAAQHAQTSVGTLLEGGYVLGERIAAGGMGQVFLAEQSALRRTVAIKFAHPHLASGPRARGRLFVEALAASRVRHRGSVAVFDFRHQEPDRSPSFLVMEHVDGRRLSEVLRSDTLPLRRCVGLVVQLLAVLEEAHRSGVLHRDVKPDNILVTVDPTGREHIKLVDYGLALVDEGRHVHGKTSPGVMYGTPGYMSPEQADGTRVDARTDVYSAAVVLHALLTKTLPGQGGGSASGTVITSARSVAVIPSSIPEPLASSLARALATNRERRTASAAAFALQLTSALSHLSNGVSGERARR